MAIDNALQSYIAALRKKMVLAKAISCLDAMVDAMREDELTEKHSGQLTLNLEVDITLVTELPVVMATKNWLLNSARFVQVGQSEEEERWNCFLTIVRAEGLSEALDWFRENCTALLVPTDVEEEDKYRRAS